jgi:hypothetical protein
MTARRREFDGCGTSTSDARCWRQRTTIAGCCWTRWSSTTRNWEVPPAYSDGEAALELSASSGQGLSSRSAELALPAGQAQLGLGVKAVLTRVVILGGWHLGRGTGRAGSARSTAELITIRVGSGS